MKNPNPRTPDRHSRVQTRLHQIVEQCLAEYLKERHSHGDDLAGRTIPHTDHVWALRQFAHELFLTLRRRPGSDFSHSTKLVVMKWFKRGLSGRLLWLIGEQIIRWRFPKSANSKES